MAITDLTGYTWVGNETISGIPQMPAGQFYFPYLEVVGNEYDTYDVLFGGYYNKRDVWQSTPNMIAQAEPGGTITLYENGNREYPSVSFEIIGGDGATNTDLIAWLEANGTLTLAPTTSLDTTMWQLNTVPDMNQDLNLTADDYNGSYNTCEYYDDGDVKLAAWAFDTVVVSTNGYVIWMGDSTPNFLYFYNEQVFDAVVAQYEQMGFVIDQSDITSKSGYFYVEQIDDAEGKFHNVRSDVMRFNDTLWDENTDFRTWLSNSSTQLDEYVISDDVVKISDYAFSECNSFDTIMIPDSVITLGRWSFEASSITEITIPDSVTSIDISCFGHCESLETINIPDSVIYIYEDAFIDCDTLREITIGTGIESIDGGAFFNCENLESITIKATTPPELGSNPFYGTNNCPIYVPASSVADYKTAWTDYADRIQPIPQTTISLDLSTIGLSTGTHNIKLKLSDDGLTHSDSSFSNVVVYTEAGWEDPTQVGDKLIITQAYNSLQTNDELEVI